MTCYDTSMATVKDRVKKTYNLTPRTIELVREMVGKVAGTQDAVVSRSVLAMARQVRDQEHARRWAQAARTPALQRELEEIAAEFEADDRAAWEVGH